MNDLTDGLGREIHMVKARLKAKIGSRISTETEDVAGHWASLINSLTASPIVGSRLYDPATFGHFQNCV